MEIDRDAEEFPFEQLARILRERIESGQYRPGTMLPSLMDLVEESGLNMTTVRRAMGLLRDEGLVVIRPGRGTFVRRKD